MSILVEADPSMLAVSDAAIGQLGLEAGATGRGFSVHDPGTAVSLVDVPDLDADQAVDSVAAAHESGREWAATTTRHRADVLRQWYDNLVAHGDELAALISREMGKPLAEARAEVGYGTDFVRWYAEEAVRSGGSVREIPAGGAHLLTRRAPVGLCVLITPWNFPLAMATRKIAPALAAGCGIVIKPADLTPLTTIRAVQLAEEAGVPSGLIQVVTTTEPASFSEAVLRDPRVRKVSFTGSTPVGKILLKLAAENVLKSSMELGGNAPLIVFDDADLDRAVEGAYAAKMRNGGQSCIAANRIYVQDGIADAFVEGLAERMARTTMGHGTGRGVGLGPLIDDRAVKQMSRLVDDAVERGARLVTGGHRPEVAGTFFEPTVLDGVPVDAAVATSEIFGPVAAVQRFSSQDEVLGRANDTPFGLAGYVFTESLDRAFFMADRLETGVVGINQGVPSNAAAPFGGVKQSGVGREGGSEGLEEYQEVRFYNLALREPV